MKVTRWNKDKILNIVKLECELKKEGLKPFVWQDEAGTYYPAHSHSYEEIRWVLRGAITFGVNGKEITLYSGDRIDLPANTVHYAKMSDKEKTVYLCASVKQ